MNDGGVLGSTKSAASTPRCASTTAVNTPEDRRGGVIRKSGRAACIRRGVRAGLKPALCHARNAGDMIQTGVQRARDTIETARRFEARGVGKRSLGRHVRCAVSKDAVLIDDCFGLSTVPSLHRRIGLPGYLKPIGPNQSCTGEPTGEFRTISKKNVPPGDAGGRAEPGSAFDRASSGLHIVLLAHALQEVDLGFQVVDVFFSVRLDTDQDFARDEILD